MSSRILAVPGRLGTSQIIWDDVACAGAIWSLLWNGVEFVNRSDDGRLIQTALTTDANEEAYNPTEGGALKDPAFGTPSDSLCFDVEQGANWFRTVSRMALWRTGALSNFILAKRVTLQDNTARFDIKVSTPADYVHAQVGAQDKLEILTGYMPPQFTLALALDRDAASVHALSQGVELRDGSGTVVGYGGEQPLPVILSKPDGSAAMGVLIPAWGNAAAGPACGYGRFRFPDCVKWNVVQRYPNPVAGCVHQHSVTIAWGTLADVVAALATPKGLMVGQISRLYAATLARAPDAEGLAFCLSWLGTGSPLEAVAAGFVQSPEFQTKYGNTDDRAFITLLYRNVLGREPDAGGLEYHLAELAAGKPRAQIVVDFSESPEFQIKRLLAQ